MKTLTFALLAVALLSCKENELRNWSAELASIKTEVVLHIDALPYRQQQNDIFKAYFSKTWELNWELSQDERKVKELNKSLAQFDIASFCDRALLKRADWQKIVRNCTVNRYFLCADAVREYDQAIEYLKRYLTPENLRRFEETPNCHA
jgi:hypothetical protein